MCYNCGCGNPVDDMGNSDNITDSTFEKASKASSQDAKKAREETYKILKKEFNTATE